MREGDRGGVGGVERERPPLRASGGRGEEREDHPPNLLLFRRAGARDGALHLGRRRLGDRDGAPRQGEEQDAPGFAERDQALGVDAGEDPLDRGGRGSGLGEDFFERRKEGREARGERDGGGGPKDAGGGEDGRRRAVENRPAGGAAPGVDAEDADRARPVYSERYFSSMSPFEKTFWTSS